MSTRPFRGVYSASLTPFGGDLEPDTAAFVNHCRWLLANGCDGLAPLGTTGEANSMSVRQRLSLIDALADAGLATPGTIVGTGSCAVADAIELSRAAVAAGNGGVLVLPPFYYKNPSEDGLFRFFSTVIDGVADDRLRVFLYHFPQLSGVPVTHGLLARLVAAFGRTIAGVKDSAGDFAATRAMIEAFPDLAIFSGSEEFLLANLRAGGAGCISASTNVTAALAQEVHGCFAEPRADALQARLGDIRRALQSVPMQAGLKYLVGRRSGASCWDNLLPPNMALTAAQTDTLVAALSAVPEARPLLDRAA